MRIDGVYLRPGDWSVGTWIAHPLWDKQRPIGRLAEAKQKLEFEGANVIIVEDLRAGAAAGRGEREPAIGEIKLSALGAEFEMDWRSVAPAALPSVHRVRLPLRIPRAPARATRAI